MPPKVFKNLEETNFYEKRRADLDHQLFRCNLDIEGHLDYRFGVTNRAKLKKEIEEKVKSGEYKYVKLRGKKTKSPAWKSAESLLRNADKYNINDYIKFIDNIYFEDPSKLETIYNDIESKRKEDSESLKYGLKKHQEFRKTIDDEIENLAKKYPDLPIDVIRNNFLAEQKKFLEDNVEANVEINHDNYRLWLKDQDNYMYEPTIDRLWGKFELKQQLLTEPLNEKESIEYRNKVSEYLLSKIEKEYLTSLIEKKDEGLYHSDAPRFRLEKNYDTGEEYRYEEFIRENLPELNTWIETPYKLAPDIDYKEYYKSLLTYENNLTSGPNASDAREKLTKLVEKKYDELFKQQKELKESQDPEVKNAKKKRSDEKMELWDSKDFIPDFVNYIAYKQANYLSKQLEYIPTFGLHNDEEIDARQFSDRGLKQQYINNFIADSKKVENELDKLVNQSEILKAFTNVPKPIQLDQVGGDVYLAYEKNEEEYAKQLKNCNDGLGEKADQLAAEATRVAEGSKFFTANDVLKWVQAKQYDGMAKLQNVVDPESVNHEDPGYLDYSVNMLRNMFTQRYRYATLINGAPATFIKPEKKDLQKPVDIQPKAEKVNPLAPNPEENINEVQIAPFVDEISRLTVRLNKSHSKKHSNSDTYGALKEKIDSYVTDPGKITSVDGLKGALKDLNDAANSYLSDHANEKKKWFQTFGKARQERIKTCARIKVMYDLASNGIPYDSPIGRAKMLACKLVCADYIKKGYDDGFKALCKDGAMEKAIQRKLAHPLFQKVAMEVCNDKNAYDMLVKLPGNKCIKACQDMFVAMVKSEQAKNPVKEADANVLKN